MVLATPPGSSGVGRGRASRVSEESMGAKLTIVGALLALLVSAVAARSGHDASSISPQPASDVPSETAYTKLLGELDARIESLRARANDRDDDWLTRMHLAAALLDRAGLTND